MVAVLFQGFADQAMVLALILLAKGWTIVRRKPVRFAFQQLVALVTKRTPGPINPIALAYSGERVML